MPDSFSCFLSLGLDHLIGTPALKPYMHGYFLSLKLYDAARVIANPFAYSEHREKVIQKKVEKLAESRIRSTKIHLPKVNAALAAKLQKDHEKRARIVEKYKLQEEDEEQEESGGEDRKQKKKRAKLEKKELAKASRPNLLEDERFKEMFENPEFEVDVDSREYGLLNPGGVADIRSTVRVYRWGWLPVRSS
jgi:ribosome biogenesis protein ENP2